MNWRSQRPLPSENTQENVCGAAEKAQGKPAKQALVVVAVKLLHAVYAMLKHRRRAPEKNFPYSLMQRSAVHILIGEPWTKVRYRRFSPLVRQG
jgi:hypothetical protein